MTRYTETGSKPRDTTGLPISDIAFKGYYIRLRMLDRVRLPVNPFSEIRGIVLQGLRAALCTHKKLDCPECLGGPYRSCIYPELTGWRMMHPELKRYGISESPAPFYLHQHGRMKRADNGYHVYMPGEFVQFGLILLGKHRKVLSFFLAGLDTIGMHRYLGRGLRGRFHVAEVYRMDISDTGLVPGDCIYLRSCGFYGEDPDCNLAEYIALRRNVLNNSSDIQIRFETPVRLMQHRRPVTDPGAELLLQRIRFRAAILSLLYDESNLQVLNPEKMAAHIASGNTYYYNHLRRGRKDGRHPYGGLLGDLTLTQYTSESLDMLIAGELLHIGKGTSQGYGQVKLYGGMIPCGL